MGLTSKQQQSTAKKKGTPNMKGVYRSQVEIRKRGHIPASHGNNPGTPEQNPVVPAPLGVAAAAPSSFAAPPVAAASVAPPVAAASVAAPSIAAASVAPPVAAPSVPDHQGAKEALDFAEEVVRFSTNLHNIDPRAFKYDGLPDRSARVLSRVVYHAGKVHKLAHTVHDTYDTVPYDGTILTLGMHNPDPCQMGLFWLAEPGDLTKDKAEILCTILPIFHGQCTNLASKCNKHREYKDESVHHPALHRLRGELRDAIEGLLQWCLKALRTMEYEIRYAVDNLELPRDEMPDIMRQ